MRTQLERTGIDCPTELAMEILGGKWKLVILEHLRDGVRRFGELRRLLPAITPRMLTRQLRELETDGIIHRHVYAEVPPKVEYSLTDLGRGLEPLLTELRVWGEGYRTRT
jgi:DNA-binding HxlR family transcriptional regulator